MRPNVVGLQSWCPGSSRRTWPVAGYVPRWAFGRSVSIAATASSMAAGWTALLSSACWALRRGIKPPTYRQRDPYEDLFCAALKLRHTAGQATRWPGPGECVGRQSPPAASFAGLVKGSLTGGVRLGERRRIDLVDQPQKAFDKRSVPLLALALPERADHFFARPPSAVGAIVTHRHEGIGNGNNPGEQGDVLAIQPVRIAGPVDSFVMVADRRQDLLGARQGGENLLAPDRMTL